MHFRLKVGNKIREIESGHFTWNFRGSTKEAVTLEFQNGGRTHDFEGRKIDRANKEDFSGRIQKTRSTYYKYNKF